MQPPYDDSDESALRFYNLFARIVIAWTRIERAIDITLHAAGYYSPQDGKAIVSWKNKAKAFGEVCADLDDSTLGKKRLADTLAKLAECALIRHTLVHGYYHGIISQSDPPRMHFRSARYNPGEIQQRELRMTHDEMFAFLRDLHELDFTVFMISVAMTTARSKARYKERMALAQQK